MCNEFNPEQMRLNGWRAHCSRRWISFGLLLLALAPAAAAGTIPASSLGVRTTNYSLDFGQQVVTEWFQPQPFGGFATIDALDGRSPIGYVVDAAASFDVSGVDTSLPMTLLVVVNNVWGYSGGATLEISGYCSSGTVSLDDFHAPPVPPTGFQVQFRVAAGDYRAAPLDFTFDISPFLASIQSAGFEHAGLTFSANDGAHGASVEIGGAFLLAGRSAVPEPTSLILLATAGAAIALWRAGGFIAKKNPSAT
jgi:hypothetical protein